VRAPQVENRCPSHVRLRHPKAGCQRLFAALTA